MPELTEIQKREIVVSFARRLMPAEIQRYFRDEYGLELELRQVTAYDPRRAAYDAGEKWREVFQLEEKAFLENAQAVPAFNQGYRLQMLQRHIEKADKAGNSVLVANLLEQCARETGGLLTNARSLTVDDKRKGAMQLTPEERREAAKEVIREALAKIAAENRENQGVIIDQRED